MSDSARVNAGTYPRHAHLVAHADEIIRSHIIGGYAPSVPVINPRARVACIGSCFAGEIAKSLAAQGRPVEPLVITERWNTAFALRHFIDAGVRGIPIPDGFLAKDVTINPKVLARLRTADAFIITLGLSLCWYEHSTGKMVMDIKMGHSNRALVGAVPLYEMRQTSVAENVAQLEAIVASIREARPNAPIVFTLSPNPLLLSLTDYPPVPSNTISKATLRVALHEMIERKLENVFYWPSYEIVEWIGRYVRLIWGQEGNDLRHLQSATVDDVMRRFSELYFRPAGAA
jgi:hypothetical protein